MAHLEPFWNKKRCHSYSYFNSAPPSDLVLVALVPKKGKAMETWSGLEPRSMSSLTVTVLLLSGRDTEVSISIDSTVGDLKAVAEESLGQGCLTLVSMDGHVLDPDLHLSAAGLHDGETLSAVARQMKLAATDRAFALWYLGGVVTRGHPKDGGQSQQIRNLTKVIEVQATDHAFAAIVADGSVATWGDLRYGGNSGEVQEHLQDVQEIQATSFSFAAIVGIQREVVTWGDRVAGGDSSGVRAQLRNVKAIQASKAAFAAILEDGVGSVVCWGDPRHGGDNLGVQDQLRNIKEIQATSSAFAALSGDGTVVTWGHPQYGGDSQEIQGELKHVCQIQASRRAFAAIRADGEVVAWGDQHCGGDSSSVQTQLKNVKQIQASFGAFAAILANGSVVAWGDQSRGGDCSNFSHLLRNVTQIQAGCAAFAAIRSDGSVNFMGCSFIRWRLQLCPKSAQRSAADTGHSHSICCHPCG